MQPPNRPVVCRRRGRRRGRRGCTSAAGSDDDPNVVDDRCGANGANLRARFDGIITPEGTPSAPSPAKFHTTTSARASNRTSESSDLKLDEAPSAHRTPLCVFASLPTYTTLSWRSRKSHCVETTLSSENQHGGGSDRRANRASSCACRPSRPSRTSRRSPRSESCATTTRDRPVSRAPSSAACSSCPHTTREARCSARKDAYLRSAAVRCAQSRSRCGGVGGGRQRSRARRVREAEHGAAARRTCSFHHEDTWALYPLGAALKSWHHMTAVTFCPQAFGGNTVRLSDFPISEAFLFAGSRSLQTTRSSGLLLAPNEQ